MRAYRKRLKANWNVGKGAKGDGEERQYAKKEIQNMLAEAEDNFFHKYRKEKRTRNERARLEYQIKWYEEFIARRPGVKGVGAWFQESLEKAKAKLAKLNTSMESKK